MMGEALRMLQDHRDVDLASPYRVWCMKGLHLVVPAGGSWKNAQPWLPSPDTLARRVLGGIEAAMLEIQRQREAPREMRQGEKPDGDEDIEGKDGEKPDGSDEEDKEEATDVSPREERTRDKEEAAPDCGREIASPPATDDNGPPLDGSSSVFGQLLSQVRGSLRDSPLGRCHQVWCSKRKSVASANSPKKAPCEFKKKKELPFLLGYLPQRPKSLFRSDVVAPAALAERNGGALAGFPGCGLSGFGAALGSGKPDAPKA